MLEVFDHGVHDRVIKDRRLVLLDKLRFIIHEAKPRALAERGWAQGASRLPIRMLMDFLERSDMGNLPEVF